MTHKFPPENNERDDDRTDSEYPAEQESRDGPEDDLVQKIYGPSQADIDRSWEGYGTGEAQRRRGVGGSIWKYVVVGVSLVILASFALGAIGPIFGPSRASEPVQRIQPERTAASVLRVIDARTIVIRSGAGEQTVRLIGIESPLFGDSLYSFAREVSQSWIGGQEVLLESDERDADEQGRLLRYVYFENVMINAALILNGLSKAETEGPNVRYDGFLADMERQAREAGIGVWDPLYNAPETDTRSSNTEASLRSEFHEGFHAGSPAS
ncbi:MAG: thermonuclease family protein [Chloroflexi bacterium]|nr:thermonuclease family protein [Chloroflexota bacterium]